MQPAGYRRHGADQSELDLRSPVALGHVECDSRTGRDLHLKGSAMKTRITELFGIQRPIIQGGMHYVGFEV